MTSAKRVDKVADACQKLYGDGDGDGKSKDLLRSFLESQVPKSDAKEIEQELKKTLLLKKLKGSKKREKKERPIKKPKKLTARQKRDLGLNRLPKKGLKYQVRVSSQAVTLDVAKKHFYPFRTSVLCTPSGWSTCAVYWTSPSGRAATATITFK